MYAQEDAAAAVLLDHLPQAPRKVANVPWPHGALVVLVGTVVLVGYEDETLE
jgi:hypothetical protein